MLFLKKRGQTTIFLCIILSALIMLTGVIIDASRIAAGEAHVKRAVRNAAKSLLCDYSAYVKENYGLFAVPAGNVTALEQKALSYIEDNLMAGGEGETDGNYLDLYGFRVENVRITPMFNLSENGVVKEQILEFMKYRGPKEIAEGFIERLRNVTSVSKMTGYYGRKIKIDGLLGKISNYSRELKECIDGPLEEGAGGVYINGFDRDGGRRFFIRSFTDSLEELWEKQEELKETEDKLKKIKAMLEGLSPGEDDSGLRQELEEADGERKSISEEVRALKSLVEDGFELLYNGFTKDYLSPNKKALECINKISTLGDEAAELIDILARDISIDFDNAGGLELEFKTEISRDLEDLQKILGPEKGVETFIEDISSNIGHIESILNRLDEVENLLWNPPGDEQIKEYIFSLLESGTSGYNNSILFEYETVGGSGEKDDPRDEPVKDAERLFSNRDDTLSDMEEAGIDIEQLPSRLKILTEPENGGKKAGELIEDVDFGSEEFAVDALGFLNSLGGIIGEKLKDSRDELFIDEYIMGMFKNSVPQAEPGGGPADNENLRGAGKSGLETFFESEVEYILNGSPNENTNRILTQAQILLIRFSLNTLHVYMDRTKKAYANSLATAIAGWWTGGAGIPLISNMIMCAWGMSEAAIDLKNLMEGKAVPFYKLDGDWKLDIGLSGLAGNKTDPRLSLSYHDYLRILLFTRSLETKLGRIEDLIEINANLNGRNIKMRSANSMLKIEATVSMKYLFVTGRFLTNRSTPDGRYVFDVVLYEGY